MQTNKIFYYAYRVFKPGFTISLQEELPPTMCRTGLEGAINLAKMSAEAACQNGGEYEWVVYGARPDVGGRVLASGGGRRREDGSLQEDAVSYPDKDTPDFKVKGGDE